MQIFVLSLVGDYGKDTLGVFSTLEKAQNTPHYDERFHPWRPVADEIGTVWRADEKWAGEFTLFIEERTLDHLMISPVPNLKVVR